LDSFKHREHLTILFSLGCTGRMPELLSHCEEGSVASRRGNLLISRRLLHCARNDSETAILTCHPEGTERSTLRTKYRLLFHWILEAALERSGGRVFSDPADLF